MIRVLVLSATSRAQAASAAAQEAHTATLIAYAQLPAQSFVTASAEATRYYQTSGRFTAGARVEDLYGIHDPATGLSRPFPGQPPQGFSGIRSLGEDRFLVFSDNGFGGQRNSADALLMVNVVRIDWEAGRVLPKETVFLSDPDRLVPFPVANEATEGHHLTGADFAIESIQPAGEGFWIGDEFGPWLL